MNFYTDSILFLAFGTVTPAVYAVETSFVKILFFSVFWVSVWAEMIFKKNLDVPMTP